MSPVSSAINRATCRIHLTGDGRWVSVALSLGDLAPGSRFLTIGERLLYEVAPADETARGYGLVNWQGGVISGARYAFRALHAPLQQVRLDELRGLLGSGDVWAISAGAALAVTRLLGQPEIPIDLGGWKIEEESRAGLPSQGIGQSAHVDSSQALPVTEQKANESVAEKPDADPAANVATEPATSVDRPRA